MNKPIIVFFKGHVIEIDENLNYVIKKDEKVITTCNQIKFATLADAEISAKLHINKMTFKKEGWTIS